MYEFVCGIHTDDLAEFFASVQNLEDFSTEVIDHGPCDLSTAYLHEPSAAHAAYLEHPVANTAMMEDYVFFLLVIEDQEKAMLFRMFHDDGRCICVTDDHQRKADRMLHESKREREEQEIAEAEEAERTKDQIKLTNEEARRADFLGLRLSNETGPLFKIVR